jgi:hypothetical protein
MLLLLLACTAPPDTAAQDTTCPVPHVTGVVVEFGSPATWASVFVRANDVDPPLQVLVDDDARFDVQLAPGEWTLGAGTADCMGPQVQIQVAACQDQDLVLDAESCDG